MEYKKTALTRRKILLAAVELISRKGLEKTTIRAISKKAGTSIGLVNYHFGSMENIFREALKLTFEEVRPIVRKRLGKGGDFGAALAANAEIYSKHEHFYRCILLSYFHAALDPEIARIHQENCRGFIDAGAGYLSRGGKARTGKARELATELFCELEGGLVLYHATRNQPLAELSATQRSRALRSKV